MHYQPTSYGVYLFFFFSSRRRHTRCGRDWSSDVCSSDLLTDKRFLHRIGQFLKAGYMEEWRYHQTYSGVPQGGTLSPILSNIYLNELDQMMAKKIAEFHQGKKRKEIITTLKRYSTEPNKKPGKQGTG